MVARFQMRRDDDHAKADQSDQECIARVQPDRRRELREASDHDAREGNAGDQHQIEQPPIDVFAIDVFRAAAQLEIGKPAQTQHAETQHIGKEFRPETGKPLHQFAAVPGMEVFGKTHIQNEQCHGNAEDSITQGIESRLGEHGREVSFPLHLYKNIKLFEVPPGRSIDFGPLHSMLPLDAGIETRFRRVPLISVRQSPQLSKARRFGVNATAPIFLDPKRRCRLEAQCPFPISVCPTRFSPPSLPPATQPLPRFRTKRSPTFWPAGTSSASPRPAPARPRPSSCPCSLCWKKAARGRACPGPSFSNRPANWPPRSRRALTAMASARNSTSHS